MISSSLDIFSDLPVLNDILREEVINVFPNAGFAKNAGVVSFDIPASATMVTSPHFDLSATFKVTKPDGSKIDNTVDVAPVCDASGFFQTVILRIGATDVERNNFYHIQTYLEHLLGFSTQAKDSWLQSTDFYVEDTPNKFENMDEKGANKGFVERSRMIVNSKTVEINTRLALEISSIGRVIPTQTNMRLELVHAPDSFRLNVGKGAAKMEFQTFILKVKRFIITPEILESMEAKFQSSALAVYPIIRKPAFSSELTQGTTSFKANIFTDQKPSYVLVTLINSVAVNGDFDKNPRNLQDYDLNKAVLYFNGSSYPQNGGYQIEWPGGAGTDTQVAQVYAELQRVTGILNSRIYGNGIGINEFVNGSTVIPFILSENELNLSYREPTERGTTRLELQFGSGLPNNVTVFAFAYMNAQINITRERSAILNYLHLN